MVTERRPHHQRGSEKVYRKPDGSCEVYWQKRIVENGDRPEQPDTASTRFTCVEVRCISANDADDESQEGVEHVGIREKSPQQKQRSDHAKDAQHSQSTFPVVRLRAARASWGRPF